MGWVLALLLIAALCLASYFLPTIIAVCRSHGYAGVIFAINFAAGWTLLGWLVALVWSLWPNERPLIEPFVGNVTGAGYRNAGDSLGAVDYGRERGRREAALIDAQEGRPVPHEVSLDQLERLARLKDAGVLTASEFEHQKARLIGLA